jgi:putative phosphoesterase
MRILLVADLHANWPAVQAVQEQFDLAICLGDLVDYGLDPAPCIDWVRRQCRLVVRGNHDHGVAQNVVVTGKAGFKFLTGVTRPLTRQRLGAPDLRYLAGLPLTVHTTIDETRFFLVHATPRDAMDEYAQPDVAFWERRLQNIDADVICVGHTHIPYVLEVGSKLVINPGSLGQPRDGDPRAAYAIVDNRRVELKRVEYPIEETVRVVQESSLSDEVKELLTQVYRTGRGAQRPPNQQPG